MRITLVLGAGGAGAWVFHAGVLAAFEDAGWDARTADLIIGTSAGAAVAAAVRGGADGHAVVEAATRRPSRNEIAEYRQVMSERKRSFRPLQPSLARHVLPGNNGFIVALAGLLPPGWFPTYPLGRFPGLDDHDYWPSGLWITAVRASDGELVVLGRDVVDISVAEAVEASSAIPGMFTPKELDGEHYVDGGSASPTHADLALATATDLVVISAPMSRPGARWLSAVARRRLATELERLQAAGIPTIVVQPDDAAPFKGFPRRRPEQAAAILEVADRATRRALEAAEVVPG